MEIILTLEGTVTLQFKNNNNIGSFLSRHNWSRSQSSYSHISSVDYRVEQLFTPFKASMSQIREWKEISESSGEN